MGDQPVVTAIRSTATVTTPLAARSLTQLCKHFEHKRPVTQDGTSGRITFSIGECRLLADRDVLALTVDAPDQERLLQLQDVIARHLRRYAFRAPMQIAWRLD